MSLLLVLGTILVVYVIATWWKNKNRKPLPPGPSFIEALPILWHMFRKNDIHQYGEILAKRYGEIFMIRFIGVSLVYVNTARLQRKMLTSAEFRDVTNDRPPSFIREYILPSRNDIAFSDYNEGQIHLRKIFHGAVRLYGDDTHDFQDMVKDEIRDFKTKMATNKPEESFDLNAALKVSIIRVLHIFMTNQKPSNEAEICEIINHFNRQLNTIFRLDINIILTTWPWLRHLPTSLRSVYTDLLATQTRLLDFFFKNKKYSGTCLINTLKAAQESDPSLSDESIASVIVNTVAGGYLTTTGFLGGFFLLMLHYPEVQKRIQKELDEVLKDKEPCLSDRSELHYTNAAIMECYRYIRHTTIGVPHMNNAEFEIEGYRIPSKSTIITNYWYMARDEQTWDEPHKYKPERYLTNDGELIPINDSMRQAFIPFGVGRRVCVGESFAKTRIFLYVTSVLQNFNLLQDELKLSPEDSAQWPLNAVIHPHTLTCLIEKRKCNSV